MTLLEYSLTTTYFQYDNVCYQQIEGAAMGSPVSPIVANLFMENFEQKALSSFHTPLKFWGRYVDDTMVIIDKNLIDEFTDHINNQHPAIKFTIEKESDGSLPMLDVLVTRDDIGNLRFKVYRKPTHTDQYLNFSSNHPLQHKLGVVRTLCDRAHSIITTEEDREEELNKVRKSLAICGYKDWSWDTALRKKDNKLKPRSKNQPERTQLKGSTTIPYIPGVTEAFQRLFCSYNIITHVKPDNTIRSLLVHPKDKTETLDKCGVIYELACLDCSSSFIGETARTLRSRVDDHKKPGTSPVYDHAANSTHSIDYEGVVVKAREEDWFKRGVKEAIHIKRKASDLNKDKGRHQLPSVYDSIISSDQSTTSDQMTQSPANSNTNISRHWRSVDAGRRPPNVQK